MRNPNAVFPVRNNKAPHTQTRAVLVKPNLNSQLITTRTSTMRYSTQSKPNPKLLDFIHAPCEKERDKALIRLLQEDKQPEKSDPHFFKPSKFEFDAATEKLLSEAIKVTQNNTNKITDYLSEDKSYKPKQ